MEQQKPEFLQAIIGLGNPGPRFYNHRHNIGFRILDELADHYTASWSSKNKHEEATVMINGKKILLIKPQTFMNDSGEIIPYLSKQGIKEDNILVIHDELELPYTKVQLRKGGSARGHNGLKSIIQFLGKEFWRLRVGIGRPENKEMVPDYVLSNFTQDEERNLNDIVQSALNTIQESVQ